LERSNSQGIHQPSLLTWWPAQHENRRTQSCRQTTEGKTTKTSKDCQQAAGPHQLDEVISHAFVILIDGVYNSIYQGLLVGLAQLCYVAKVHICNAAIWHGKDVSWMWVPMEQPKLHVRQEARCKPVSEHVADHTARYSSSMQISLLFWFLFEVCLLVCICQFEILAAYVIGAAMFGLNLPEQPQA